MIASIIRLLTVIITHPMESFYWIAEKLGYCKGEDGIPFIFVFVVLAFVFSFIFSSVLLGVLMGFAVALVLITLANVLGTAIR